MTNLTAKWHAEHVQFARLLGLLDEQVSTFHDGGQPNYELMHDIVFYLTHYGDRFHHPHEDVAFDRLISHDASLRGPILRLQQEHRVIGSHGAQLLERLAQASAAGSVVSRGVLESAAATYLVYYRHHLMTEERDILPKADALLTEEDWVAVARTAVDNEPDPLFGADPQERFRELRRQIARDAA